MNIAYLTDGRDWAYRIAKGLSETKGKKWKIAQIVTTPEILFPGYPVDKLGIDTKIIDPKELRQLYSDGFFNNFDILLFYGWSWMVPEEIVKNKVCICSHPSPLPKYRGGSPIQHQIIKGEKETMVSLFQMTQRLDDGPVYKQKPLSLEGHLKDIIQRIGETSLQATVDMLDELVEGKIKPTLQDESKATIYKRRKKSESELTIEQLNKLSAHDMFNFVRALEDPYPNAYIKLADGKLLLKRVNVVETSGKKCISTPELKLFKKEELKNLLNGKLFLKCVGGGQIEILEAILE